MFISLSSPSHGSARSGFGHLLFIRPLMLVSRNVSRSVNYVYSSRLTLPAAGFVKTLLVRPCKLGGVRKTTDCWGSDGSLRRSSQRKFEFLLLKKETCCETCETFRSNLTVTPEMTGDFPSISWNTSASASSPVLSLYFFLASSPSATLNSSNMMVRLDFFL